MLVAVADAVAVHDLAYLIFFPHSLFENYPENSEHHTRYALRTKFTLVQISVELSRLLNLPAVSYNTPNPTQWRTKEASS